MKTTYRIIITVIVIIAGGCKDFLNEPIQGTYSNATFYKTKHSFFPSANVDENLLGRVLAENFIPESVEITVKHLPNHADQGYTGIIMATARK